MRRYCNRPCLDTYTHYSVNIANIAANTVVAILSASQEAGIEGVTINTSGDGEVKSTFNNGEKGRNRELADICIRRAGSEPVVLMLTQLWLRIRQATRLYKRCGYWQWIIGRECQCIADGSSYANAKIEDSAISVGLLSVGLTILTPMPAVISAHIDTTGGAV